MTKRHAWSFNPQELNSYLASEVLIGDRCDWTFFERCQASGGPGRRFGPNLTLEMIALDDLLLHPNPKGCGSRVAPQLGDHWYGGWLGVDRARELLLNLERVAGPVR
jgi:hypothetical protein